VQEREPSAEGQSRSRATPSGQSLSGRHWFRAIVCCVVHQHAKSDPAARPTGRSPPATLGRPARRTPGRAPRRPRPAGRPRPAALAGAPFHTPRRCRRIRPGSPAPPAGPRTRHPGRMRRRLRTRSACAGWGRSQTLAGRSDVRSCDPFVERVSHLAAIVSPYESLGTEPRSAAGRDVGAIPHDRRRRHVDARERVGRRPFVRIGVRRRRRLVLPYPPIPAGRRSCQRAHPGYVAVEETMAEAARFDDVKVLVENQWVPLAEQKLKRPLRAQ
jgi:hypothetical protein